MYSATLACTKKPPVCPKTASIEKIQGLSSKVLEKPMDKTKIKLGNYEFILMINKNSQLIIQQKHAQQVLLDLKNTDGRRAYYAELDWAGDNNQDCQADLVIWKKPGIYLGKNEVESETHNEARDEKFYIESQKNESRPYKIQSLGKY